MIKKGLLYLVLSLCAIVLQAQVPCQEYTATIDTNVSLQIVDSSFLNLCKGAAFTLRAKGDYSSISGYSPSDETSTFYWDMGDGTQYEGQQISHNYPTKEGFRIRLQIKDKNNCMSKPLDLIARVAQPQVQVHPPHYACSDIITELSYGADSTAQLRGIPTGYASRGYQFKHIEQAFLVKENSCPDQCAIQQLGIEGLVTDSIKSEKDLHAVLLTIEHDYTGDLELQLQCPNGQSTYLKKHPNQISKQHILGTPEEDDQNNPCDALNNPAGVGSIYGWSVYYDTISTLTAYDLDPEHTEKLIPPTDTTNKSGYFVPEEAGFSALIGCPVNGQWELSVCDKNGENNGYLFSWALEFAPHFYPESILYEVPLQSYSLYNTAPLPSSATHFHTKPKAGIQQYKFQVTDAYDCQADTNFSINTKQSPAFTLGKDTNLLKGQELLLSPNPSYPDAIYLWSNGMQQMEISVDENDTYWLKAEISYPEIRCAFSDSIELGFDKVPEIHIPPIITPNNDGYNDILYIEALDYLSNTGILIYNRWGNLVYENKNYQNNWQPADLPSGTYYLLLHIKSPLITPSVYKSHFSILH